MTKSEAKYILTIYGLKGLICRTPVGLDINEIFQEALDYISGADLDVVLFETFGSYRNTRVNGFRDTESDDSFRNRVRDCDIVADYTTGSYQIFRPIKNMSKICNHSWKLYQGLIKTYEYCTNCDEKKL